MQPQETTQNAPRRPLDVEDYIDVVRRHKAWIFGPAFAALVVAVVVAYLWPDTYVSNATIRIVPPQVPESFVPTNINTDLQGRLNSMTQVILNRSTLTAIINTYGLYQDERKRQPLDDVIEKMRSKDISIGNLQSFSQVGGKAPAPAFQIGFSYRNRFIAQKVTHDLVGRFLVENQNETTQQTMSTTEFLQSSWASAKKKLDGLEAKLSTFRAKNMGRLPDQQQANFQQLNAMQAQMLNLNTSMSRVNQEKLLLENQVRIYKEQLANLKDPSSLEQQAVAPPPKSDKLLAKEREVTQIENSLTAARERYKETYPDVQDLVERLATARRERDAMAKAEESRKPEAPSTKPQTLQYVREQRDLESALKRVQGMIEAKDLEMRDYQKQASDLNASLKSYQSRMASMPVGIREYEELARDRDLAKKEYEDLNRKMESSQLSTQVINRQQGERLELLDDANLPQTPTQPKRSIIVLVGFGAGILLGLAIAGIRELRDQSLKNLKDVRAYTQLPVLGSVPFLENDRVLRHRRRMGWLAWSTACLIGLIVMSSSVLYYYSTRS